MFSPIISRLRRFPFRIEPQALAILAFVGLFSSAAQAQLSMTTPYSSLSAPVALAVDSAGNIYIANTGANAVIEEYAVGGSSTLGFTGLSSPGGVAVDSSGNLYIADTGNNEIRELSASGTFSVLATGFSSPSGLAVDSAGAYLYVADTANNLIKKVTLPGGSVSTVAGGGTSSCPGDSGPATSACLSNPVGVAVDSSGNLYIADRDDYRVRKVDHTTGYISTVAGNGSPGLTGGSIYAYGVTLDTGGDLFIGAGTMLFEVPSGSSQSAFACSGSPGDVDGHISGSGTICEMADALIQGLAFDPYGNLFIPDPGNNAIREIAGAGTGEPCSTTATLLLSHVTYGSHVTNPSGPLTSSGGDALLSVSNHAPGGASVTWSGFPACTVPSGGLTLTIDTLTLQAAGDLADATIGVLSPSGVIHSDDYQSYPGVNPYTVTIPANTPLGTVRVNSAVGPCSSGSPCGANSDVGYIHIN